MKDPLYNLELRIAKLLRYGVLFAGLLIFMGWLGLERLSPDPFLVFHTYKPVGLFDLLQGYRSSGNWGGLVCCLGLGLLVGLPSLRVLLTCFLFFKRKDYVLAAIAAFVFAALVASFTLGIEF